MRLALAAVIAAGCYNPSYENCKVTCASNNGCPSGYSCDMALGVCRTPNGSCGGGDGGVDTPDAKELCGWTFASNFDPCVLGNANDIMIGQAAHYNTETGMSNDFPVLSQGAVLTQPSGPSIRMLQFGDLNILPAGTLTITGKMPLLIVARTVIIDGVLDVSASNLDVAPACTATGGLSTNGGGGGGGGGGFASTGGSGGEGGMTGTVTGHAQGGAAIMGGFSPLLASCPGRPGKGAGNATGGVEGAAGGSLQITAHDRIDISGAIRANGSGGGGGMTSLTGCSGGPCGAGGGGGGAGGLIFLEAPQVAFTGAQVKLCANGGSGGGGATGNAAGGNGTGGGQLCGNAQPTIGLGANGGGPGGGGGYVARANGVNGEDGDASLATSAGGGGGGSVGRIGVRGTMTGARQIESPLIQILP